MLMLLALLASAEPVTLTWQGRALDASGMPVESQDTTVTVRIYDAVQATVPLHEESLVVDLERGYFAVRLTMESELLMTDALYADLDVGGTTLVQRDPIDAVPRAATALSVPTPYAVPIGGVIPWCRPVASEPIPAGYAVADGSTLSDHGFGVAGPITLPDLRNRFVLGASIDVADGSPGTSTDGPGAAPGIGGTGGSQAPRSTDHTHPVSQTVSTSSTGEHTHGLSGTTNTTGGHGHQLPFGDAGDGLGWQRSWPHVSSTPRDLRLNSYADDRPRGGSVSTYQSATAGEHSHSVGGSATASGTHAHSVTIDTTAGASGTAVDVRPAYVGMLYLIRVR